MQAFLLRQQKYERVRCWLTDCLFVGVEFVSATRKQHTGSEWSE